MVPFRRQSQKRGLDQRRDAPSSSTPAAAAFPLHPLPAMQAAFEESMLDAAGHTGFVPFPAPSKSVKARQQLLCRDGDAKEPAWNCTYACHWRLHPAARFHPLLKTAAQVVFGVHLLHQRLEKSVADVADILLKHVHELDGFLQRANEDMESSLKDMLFRRKCLKVPMEHVNEFDRLLDDRSYRAQLLDGNVTIDRTTARMSALLDDYQADMAVFRDANQALDAYLAAIGDAWTRHNDDVARIYAAMRGNAGGWAQFLQSLAAKADKLRAVLDQVGSYCKEIEKRCGAASRRDLIATRSSSRNSSKSRDNARPLRSYAHNKPLPTVPSEGPAFVAPSNHGSGVLSDTSPAFRPAPQPPQPGSAESPNRSEDPASSAPAANIAAVNAQLQNALVGNLAAANAQPQNALVGNIAAVSAQPQNPSIGKIAAAVNAQPQNALVGNIAAVNAQPQNSSIGNIAAVNAQPQNLSVGNTAAINAQPQNPSIGNTATINAQPQNPPIGNTTTTVNAQPPNPSIGNTAAVNAQPQNPPVQPEHPVQERVQAIPQTEPRTSRFFSYRRSGGGSTSTSTSTPGSTSAQKHISNPQQKGDPTPAVTGKDSACSSVSGVSAISPIRRSASCLSPQPQPQFGLFPRKGTNSDSNNNNRNLNNPTPNGSISGSLDPRDSLTALPTVIPERSATSLSTKDVEKKKTLSRRSSHSSFRQLFSRKKNRKSMGDIQE